MIQSDKILVLIFSYKRYDSIKNLCENLLNCERAFECEYVFFLDGPKRDSEFASVKKVSDQINLTLKNSPLSYKLIRSETNLGLKQSILNGLRYVCNSGYERFIVLEDDLVLDKRTILYFKKCFDKYTTDMRVGTISAFSYPLSKERPAHLYMSYRFSSWGWGSWVSKIEDFFDQKNNCSLGINEILKLVNCGIDIPYMLLQSKDATYQSWAIVFQKYLAVKGMKTIYPSISLVSNFGYHIGTHADGVGHNTNVYSKHYNYVVRCNLLFSLMMHVYIIRHYLRYMASKLIKNPTLIS